LRGRKIGDYFLSKVKEITGPCALHNLLLHLFGFIHILIGQSDHPIHFLSFANIGRPAN
jgi:hypothetical protein